MKAIFERLKNFYQQQPVHCWLGAVGFWLTSLSVMVFLSLPRPSVVTYNAAHTIRLFSKEIAAAQLKPKQMKQLSQQFSHELKTTLMQYAHHHHVTILKNDDIIVSQKDITSEIEQQLAKNMQAHS
jgi:type-F conjugative transfer system protein TrbI